MKLRKLLRSYLLRAGVRLPYVLLDKDLRAFRRIAKLVGSNDIVIDLGAHVGFATIEFAHRACHVYAFEPNPENFSELRRNTRRYSNVTIFQNAVAGVTGSARLYYEPPKPGKFFEGATIINGKSNIGYSHFFDVEAIAVDEVLDQIGTNVALIKMDIEGAEYIVLDALIASGRMDQVGKVYIECHADRVPHLADAKARTLAAAASAGVLEKLDFNWP